MPPRYPYFVRTAKLKCREMQFCPKRPRN